MADRVWFFVMVPMVYLAFAWCAVRIVINVVRIMTTSNQPPTLRIFLPGGGPGDPPSGGWLGAIRDAVTMPSLRKFHPLLWCFLIVFHVSLCLLVLAHLDLLPQIDIMPADSPHMLGNGAVGAVFTVCLLYLLFRRFRGPVREVSVPADYLLLFLLICIAVSGDIISWGNSWTDEGFVMTKKDFAAYLDSLIKFKFTDPRTFLSGSHYAVVGIHVLLANIFLFVLPFSKIMHTCFAVPMNKRRRG